MRAYAADPPATERRTARDANKHARARSPHPSDTDAPETTSTTTSATPAPKIGTPTAARIAAAAAKRGHAVRPGGWEGRRTKRSQRVAETNSERKTASDQTGQLLQRLLPSATPLIGLTPKKDPLRSLGPVVGPSTHPLGPPPHPDAKLKETRN